MIRAAVRRGAITTEYILILAIISIPLLIVLGLFVQKIIGWFQAGTDQLQNMQ